MPASKKPSGFDNLDPATDRVAIVVVPNGLLLHLPVP
jgi:hypothetical protein